MFDTTITPKQYSKNNPARYGIPKHAAERQTPPIIYLINLYFDFGAQNKQIIQRRIPNMAMEL